MNRSFFMRQRGEGDKFEGVMRRRNWLGHLKIKAYNGRGIEKNMIDIHIHSYSTTRAPIGRNRSRDAIVSLLNGRLSAHSARFWQFSVKNC